MNEAIAIPIMALLIPIIVAPTAIVFRYVRFHRETEHAARMRALELGRPLPGDEPWWSPERIIVAIGAGVPLGSLLMAFAACESFGFRKEIWGMSSVVAMIAVISGAILAGRQFAARERERNRRLDAQYHAKPAYDPEAFEVVGR